MSNLQESILFAQAGINNIQDDEMKNKFQERLNSLAESTSNNIDDALKIEENEKYFDKLKDKEVTNRVSAVLANIGTMANNNIAA